MRPLPSAPLSPSLSPVQPADWDWAGISQAYEENPDVYGIRRSGRERKEPERLTAKEAASRASRARKRSDTLTISLYSLSHPSHIQSTLTFSSHSHSVRTHIQFTLTFHSPNTAAEGGFNAGMAPIEWRRRWKIHNISIMTSNMVTGVVLVWFWIQHGLFREKHNCGRCKRNSYGA